MQYCFNYLTNLMNPSEIYKLFLPENEVFKDKIGNDFPTNKDMLDII